MTQQHNEEERQRDKKETRFLLILAVLLLVFSLVQTFEINDLKQTTNVGSGAARLSNAPLSAPTASAGSQPASAMVGGC